MGFPSKREIRQMREVTHWQGTGGHQVFIGEHQGQTSKFTIENKLRDSFRLRLMSRAVLQTHPKIALQLVTRRRGKITQQNYFHGELLPQESKLTNGQIMDISNILAKLHNSKVPLILRPFARKDFRHRINKALKKLKQTQTLTPKEIEQCFIFLAHIPNATTAICHNDIHSGNMINTKNGLAILDFGDANVGLKEAELGKTITNLYFTKSQRDLFLNEYKANGGDITLFEQHEDYWTAFGLIDKLRRLTKTPLKKGSAKEQKVTQLKQQLLQIIK